MPQSVRIGLEAAAWLRLLNDCSADEAVDDGGHIVIEINEEAPSQRHHLVGDVGAGHGPQKQTQRATSG